MARVLALVNAEIWTLDALGERAEGLLVDGSRIRFVGEERAVLRKAQSEGATVEDARGLRVLPGLIDSHTHLVHQGLLADRLDLWETPSKTAALEGVRRALRTHRGKGPLLAERWDESRWAERAYPTRDELDALSRTIPIILRRVDGHVAVANGVACRLLKGRLKGVDEDRGLLLEEASLNLNQVFPTPTARSVRAIRAAQERALGLGLTGVHDFVVPTYWDAYRRLDRAGRLKLRVYATPYAGQSPAPRRTPGTHQRLQGGGVKAFADGSIGGHTAAFTKPYADDPGNRGRLNWTDRNLRALVAESARAGEQPSLHAIGDAAIGQVLDAYGRLPAKKRRRIRPRIEHYEVPTAEHTRQAVAAGIVLSMQPNFVGEWSRPRGLYDRRFGDARRCRNNEFRRLVDAGASMAFGSDCMPLDPWWGIESCVHAPYASQRLRLEEALRAYSGGSAWGLGWEARVGSLRAGKEADLILVRGAWNRTGGLRSTRVEATMIAGTWVWRRRKSPRRR